MFTALELSHITFALEARILAVEKELSALADMPHNARQVGALLTRLQSLWLKCHALEQTQERLERITKNFALRH